MAEDSLTALKASLVGCHSCHLVCRAPLFRGKLGGACPRCGAVLHQRKPNSIPRTWALVIAAFIFYIPANVLPITLTTSLGTTQSDTIMSGVIYFITTGSWPIALVIFIASIVVPLAKLLILTFLLISLQYIPPGRPELIQNASFH